MTDSATGPRWGDPVDTARGPWFVSGLGASLVLVVLLEWVVFARLQLDLILTAGNVVGLLTSSPFVLGLIYGGYWLDRSGLGPDRYRRVVGWCVGGLAVFLAMNMLTSLVMWPDHPWLVVGWYRWAASVGAGVGLFIGVIEARAIDRARAAERAATRAEEAEAQREWFDYLHSLLRHEVLNTANVVTGQAGLAMEKCDCGAEVHDHLETVQCQSQSMTRVIEDVKVLLATTEEAAGFEAVDLAGVVREELVALRQRYDGVTTEASLPDGAVVMADDLLPRLFSNLLVNAVKHNDSDRPEVRVTGEVTPEMVRVRVADDGPGIPEEDFDTLFERDTTMRSSHGLGLYLVRTLAERYGGSVEVTRTGPEGTTLTVRLPRAAAGPRGRPAEAPAVADGGE